MSREVSVCWWEYKIQDAFYKCGTEFAQDPHILYEFNTDFVQGRLKVSFQRKIPILNIQNLRMLFFKGTQTKIAKTNSQD